MKAGKPPYEKIIIATKNRGKVEEIRALLEGLGVEILTLDDVPPLTFPPETGSTFAENSLQKARFVASTTGTTALADDSGLVVDRLGGAPGVYSARYSGPGASDRDNYEKLLRELSGVPPEERGARFVCVAALATPAGDEATFEGRVEGRISQKPAGDGGFGYDPVFYLPEKRKTVAQLSAAEKNIISHRGEALRKLKAWLLKD